jgi:hypothetical protein
MKARLTKDILEALPMTDSLFTFCQLLCAQHTASASIADPYPASNTDMSEFTLMEDNADYSQKTMSIPESPISLSNILPMNLFDL